jgi:hypothetical protein
VPVLQVRIMQQAASSVSLYAQTPPLVPQVRLVLKWYNARTAQYHTSQCRVGSVESTRFNVHIHGEGVCACTGREGPIPE